MKTLILAILTVITLGCLNTVEAQPYDINKAKFQWNYPIDQPITHFRFKCATTKDGPHTLITTISEELTKTADPLVRQFPIKTVITQRGDYECFATALNNGLESDPSNEIFFSTEIGASIPGNYSIVGQ